MLVEKRIRICRQCGRQFTQENGRQVYCSTACRNAAKNAAKRIKRHIHSDVVVKESNVNLLEQKQYLSISQAAVLLSVSRPTIYRKIEQGELHPVKVSTRTVRIPIEELMKQTTIQPEVMNGDFSKTISKKEALQRYETSEAWFYKVLAAEGIKPKRINKVSYYPFADLERLFKLRSKPDDVAGWWTAEDLASEYGMTRKYVNGFARDHNIPRRKVGIKLFINKEEWDKARIMRGTLEEDYLTVAGARIRYHIGQERFYNEVNAAGLQRIRQGREVFFAIKDLDKLFKN